MEIALSQLFLLLNAGHLKSKGMERSRVIEESETLK